MKIIGPTEPSNYQLSFTFTFTFTNPFTYFGFVPTANNV